MTRRMNHGADAIRDTTIIHSVPYLSHSHPEIGDARNKRSDDVCRLTMEAPYRISSELHWRGRLDQLSLNRIHTGLAASEAWSVLAP